MAEYEIQKDFGKVVNWLSSVKEQAYQSVDNAYKEIKANAAKEHRSSAAVGPKPVSAVGSKPEGTIGVAAAYGLLLLLVLFFLYRDKESWFRRRVSLGLSRVRHRWLSKSSPPTDF